MGRHIDVGELSRIRFADFRGVKQIRSPNVLPFIGCSHYNLKHPFDIGEFLIGQTQVRSPPDHGTPAGLG